MKSSEREAEALTGVERRSLKGPASANEIALLDWGGDGISTSIWKGTRREL